VKRKFFSVLFALLAAILITSTVFAGHISLSRVSFSIGSLKASGTLTGVGKQDVIVQLEASGTPLITCTNQGGNQAPGQNPPKVSASGNQVLSGNKPHTKNGKIEFTDVETENPTDLDPIVFGCPNENWTASIDFVFWENAKITVLAFDNQDKILVEQDYTCTTTLTSVICTPIN
jgi:hypothetical protein